jgi:ABC-type glycerol-3-phosphate transport system permease component
VLGAVDYWSCKNSTSWRCPTNSLEAARIDDGAGELTIFVRVVVPMLAPALAVM